MLLVLLLVRPWSVNCDAFNEEFPIGFLLFNRNWEQKKTGYCMRAQSRSWQCGGLCLGRAAGPVRLGSPRVHRTVTGSGGQRRVRLLLLRSFSGVKYHNNKCKNIPLQVSHQSTEATLYCIWQYKIVWCICHKLQMSLLNKILTWLCCSSQRNAADYFPLQYSEAKVSQNYTSI